jgi:hypothetical protein
VGVSAGNNEPLAAPTTPRNAAPAAPANDTSATPH